MITTNKEGNVGGFDGALNDRQSQTKWALNDDHVQAILHIDM